MIREFSALDPAHAADYKTRGEAYKKQLQGVRDELVKEISNPAREPAAHSSPAKAPSPTWRQTRD